MLHRKLHIVLFTVWALSLLANAVVLLTPASTARAQGSGPYEVVATNLDNPRHLTFGPDGALYIAEAGHGGDGPCIAGGGPPEVTVASPVGDAPDPCYGPSGAVTRVRFTPTISQTRVIRGVASHAVQEPSLGLPAGSQATGLHDVSISATGAFGVVGLGNDPAVREQAPEFANFGQLGAALPNGQITNTADLAAFEATNNPDGGRPDSNPYALINDGTALVVADAGGNDLLRVSAGTIVTITTFPTRTVDAPPFLGLPPGSQIPMESVPTSVALGFDGAYYVGELTGFPFPVDEARIYRVDRTTGATTIFAEGFTNVVDVAFDAQGNLYVLEFARSGLLQIEAPAPGQQPDLNGALIRVSADGTMTETIASDGLIVPGGVAVGPDGMLYVSTYSVFPCQISQTNPDECASPTQLAGADGPPTGQVVRIDPNAPSAVTVAALEANPVQRALRPSLALLALATTAGVLFMRRRR